MKKLILTLGLTFGMVYLVSAQTATPGIRQRQRAQIHRIGQGINSGQLTRNEARNLIREQRRIQQQKRIYQCDGIMNRAERRQIYREQNRASRRIYGYGNNGMNR